MSDTLIQLSLIGRYDSGIRGASGAEIVAHDPLTQRLFVVNASVPSVEVLDIANPAAPARVDELQESVGDANSVSIYGGLMAVAIAADPKTDPGRVVFYTTDTLERLAEFTVGALPDMLTFTPDGSALLVANEGEPSSYEIGPAGDPEGSVSVIDLRAVTDRRNASNLQNNAVIRTAGFDAFNGDIAALRAAGVRIYGPNATVAQDLEPEYIAVAPDGRTAWVALQEANAHAVLDLSDLDNPVITEIRSFGLKDHNLIGNELDASDQDNRIHLRNWPVKGMYMPDAIASYGFNGRTYYVTANEGDARDDWPGYQEGYRISSGTFGNVTSQLAAAAGLPDSATLRLPANLGRLTVSRESPVDGGGLRTEIHAFGARSFSIWADDGTQVFDSGSDFERITAQRYPQFFNASNSNNTFDNRSDDKGPEPEGVTLGKIAGRTFAFIGLERIGGVMVYDVSNPENARFVQYLNTRDFTVAPDGPTANDSGAEGLAFISAENSPLSGVPLLVIGNEVSGTTTIFRIDPVSLSP